MYACQFLSFIPAAPVPYLIPDRDLDLRRQITVLLRRRRYHRTVLDRFLNSFPCRLMRR
jgi:hypothetical protein